MSDFTVFMMGLGRITCCIMGVFGIIASVYSAANGDWTAFAAWGAFSWTSFDQSDFLGQQFHEHVKGRE